MSSALTVEVRKLIPASRRTVFEAWLNPHALGRFMKPSANMPDCHVEVDPKEGGRFKIVMMAGDTEIPIHGEYKTIRHYDLLVFSWISERTSPDSTVTLTFEEKGPAETEITLSHTGLPDERSRSDHEKGWITITDLLATEVL